MIINNLEDEPIDYSVQLIQSSGSAANPPANSLAARATTQYLTGAAAAVVVTSASKILVDAFVEDAAGKVRSVACYKSKWRRTLAAPDLGQHVIVANGVDGDAQFDADACSPDICGQGRGG